MSYKTFFAENITYFDLSENTFAWRGTRPAEVQQRRALMSDMLLYDTLLSLGGIKEPEMLYPPTDVPGLRRLLDAIESSEYDRLKRDCLIYYLLLWYTDGREDQFGQERSILPQFTALAKAYWHVDTGIDISTAVSLLSDARLNKEYTSKILFALSQDPQSSPLVLMYVRTAKPPVTQMEDIAIYLSALLESSFLEAWRYQRSFSELDPLRPKLLKQIFNWCVTPAPRPAALEQLLAFCLSPWEQSQLQAHVLDPEATIPHNNLSFLQTLVCVRLIQGGRYAEAIKMDRLISSQPALKSYSAERAQMMQELYATLSPTERVLLDVELEPAYHRDPEPKSASSMSQSWVDIRNSPPKPSPKPNGVLLSSSTSSRPNNSLNLPRLSLSTSSQRPPQDPVAALFNNTPARGSPIPTIPVSNSLANRPTPRKSGPLFANLPNTPSAFSKPPLHSTSSFDSAARKSNAFYRPSSGALSQSTNNKASNAFSASTNGATPTNEDGAGQINGGGDTDVEMDMDYDNVGREDAHSSGSLGFSIFGGTSSNPSIPPPTDGPSSSKAAPPGGFIEEDDDGRGDHHGEDVAMGEQSPPPRQQQRKTRQTRNKPSAAAPPSQPQQSTSRQTKAIKEKQKEKVASSESMFRSSIPGSFAMEDEDEEVEDTVAPLPTSVAPPRGVRRSRASVALSDASTDEGDEGRATTRRRSSRLSSTTAGDVKKASSSTSKPKKTTTTARKKR